MPFELRQPDLLEVLRVAVDLSRDVAVLDRGELRGETAQAHRDASRLRGGEQILQHRVVSREVVVDHPGDGFAERPPVALLPLGRTEQVDSLVARALLTWWPESPLQ